MTNPITNQFITPYAETSKIIGSLRGEVSSISPVTVPWGNSFGAINIGVDHQAILSLNYSLDQLRNYSQKLYLDYADIETYLHQYENASPIISPTGDSITYTENGVLQEGEYVIDVQQLAQGEILSSDFLPDAFTPLNQWGEFLIDGHTIVVEREDSLQDIRDKINAQTTSTVASIEDGKLVLTSTSIGRDATVILEDGGTGDGFVSTNESTATTEELLSLTNWSVDVSITQLAQKQVVRSDTQSSATSALGLDGTFTINGTTFTVTTGMSLTDIRNMVNNRGISVEASIQNRQLYFTSRETGASEAFTVSDGVTSSKDVYSSSKPSIVSIKELLSASDWQHTVTVTQLAERQTVRSGLPIAGYQFGRTWNTSFKVNGKTIQVNPGDSVEDVVQKIDQADNGVRAYLVPYDHTGGSMYIHLEGQLGQAFTVEDSPTEILRSVFQLVNSNGDLRIVNEAKKATYTVDGVQKTSNSNTGISISGHVKVDFLTTGTSVLKNEHSDPILKGIGLISTGTSFKHLEQTAKDLTYTVDGRSGSSSQNVGVMIQNEHGENLATIEARSTGSTTVYHQTGNVLEAIGIVDGANNKKHIDQVAQDARYAINGEHFTSSHNTGIGTEFGVEMSLAREGRTTLTIAKEKELLLAANDVLEKSYNTFLHFLERHQRHIASVVPQQLLSISEQNLSTLQSIGLTLLQDGSLHTTQFRLTTHHLGELEHFITDVRNMAKTVAKSPFGTFANQEYIASLYQDTQWGYWNLINERF